MKFLDSIHIILNKCQENFYSCLAKFTFLALFFDKNNACMKTRINLVKVRPTKFVTFEAKLSCKSYYNHNIIGTVCMCCMLYNVCPKKSLEFYYPLSKTKIFPMSI